MGGLISSLTFQPPNDFNIYNIDHCKLEWIKTKKHKNIIPTLYYKNPNSKYTLLYSHGNATTMFGIVSDIVKIAKILNVSLFMYEYSGYSISPPKNYMVKTCAEKDDIYKLIYKEQFIQLIKPNESTARDDIVNFRKCI